MVECVVQFGKEVQQRFKRLQTPFRLSRIRYSIMRITKSIPQYVKSYTASSAIVQSQQRFGSIVLRQVRLEGKPTFAAF